MFGRRDDPAALRNKAIPLATRCRLGYVAGVEERAREAAGRGLTHDGFLRARVRYPGDPDVVARWEHEWQGERP
jgi:hypothetical protein